MPSLWVTTTVHDQLILITLPHFGLLYTQLGVLYTKCGRVASLRASADVAPDRRQRRRQALLPPGSWMSVDW